MNKSKVLLVFSFVSLILLPFQNCSSDVEFSTLDPASIGGALGGGDPQASPTPPAPEITPPAATPTPVCVQGKKLGVWLDPDKSGDLKAEYFLGDIVSYSGNKTSVENYNYFSASAHPIVGPAPSDYSVKVFFYEGPDGLALSFFYNVDDGGSVDNVVNWNLQTSGNNQLDNVLLSDDSGELKLTDSSNMAKKYEGRFHYWVNTDGGVVGPFLGDNYKIQVQVLDSGDNNNAAFFSANGAVFSLQDYQDTISSFVIAFRGYEVCQ